MLTSSNGIKVGVIGLAEREWLDTIERVQNTHLHRVGHDGVYRDAQGVELQDSTGVTKGVRGLVKGIQGSIARVRGTGGF